MKTLKPFIYISIVLMLASCAVSMPTMVTNNPVGTKVGVAERTIWFNITFGHTDLGLQTAAKNGGIKKIATVDRSIKSGFFNITYKTTVTGE